MTAIIKRISLTTSECDAASLLGEVVSHVTPKTIFQNIFFSFPWIFYLRIELLPVIKCTMRPNLHISKMAAVRTAKMLIAITHQLIYSLLIDFCSIHFRG